jgi:hypothetical protein
MRGRYPSISVTDRLTDSIYRPSPTVWGSKLPFNTVCGEYSSPSGGWVHSVGFSPSGDLLAFTGHDSTINIVYPNGPTVFTIRMSTLPLVAFTWTSEQTIVAAGHDCQPLVFGGSEGGWQEMGTLDDGSNSKAGAKSTGPGRLNTGAFQTFKNADSRGQGATSGDTKLTTVHQNTITSVRPYQCEYFWGGWKLGSLGRKLYQCNYWKNGWNECVNMHYNDTGCSTNVVIKIITMNGMSEKATTSARTESIS